MILIRKGSCPQSWRTFARTPGAAFTSAPKDDLRASLIREQGYICAYCMKRIDLGIDVNGENKTRIEHIKAESKSLRENHPEETNSTGRSWCTQESIRDYRMISSRHHGYP